MLRSNLETKKRLASIVREAYNSSKAGFLDRISDFFTRGSKEYKKYLDEMDSLISKIKKSGKETIKDGIDITPLTGCVLNTEIIGLCSSNFSLMMRNKPEEARSITTAGLKPKKWFITKPNDILGGKETSDAKFIPVAIKEKKTSRAQGTHIANMFKDNDSTFTIYGVSGDADQIIEITEAFPYFNEEDFSPKKLKLNSKADVIKAMETIKDKATKAYSNVKEGLNPNGFSKKESEGSSLGNTHFIYTDAILRNQCNLYNIRLARLCFHCCKELSNLLK